MNKIRSFYPVDERIKLVESQYLATKLNVITFQKTTVL